MPTHHITTGALHGAGAQITVGSAAIQLQEHANTLLAGLKALANSDATAAGAAVFLGSWSLELFLKSHLASVGKTKSELRPIQHNLVALWEQAAQTGLPITSKAPPWCELLSATHDKPYIQRYESQTAAWAAPNINQLLQELLALQAIVRKGIA